MILNKKELIKWKVLVRIYNQDLIFDNNVIRLWKSTKDTDDNGLPIFIIEKLDKEGQWYTEYEF